MTGTSSTPSACRDHQSHRTSEPLPFRSRHTRCSVPTLGVCPWLDPRAPPTARLLPLTMLDAVYLDTIGRRGVTAIAPKPAFRPLFEIANFREGSRVELVGGIDLGEPAGKQPQAPALT